MGVTNKMIFNLLAGFFTGLLVIYSTPSNAQEITPENQLDYIIEDFPIPGGRLANNVNCIVQGPFGFMWFGTHGGVHRYDGNEFVTYTSVPGDTIGETTTLTYPYVESLYWDRFDKMWVTTYGGGLYRFDPVTETFTHYDHDPEDDTSLSHDQVFTTIEDTEGRLWIGTAKGLNLFDRETETFKRYLAAPENPKSLIDDDIRKLYVDNEGTMWMGSGATFFEFNLEGGALSKYHPDTDSFTNYIYDPEDENTLWTSSSRGMTEDSNGNFWVGTANGLHKMDRANGTFERMSYSEDQPFAPGMGETTNAPVYSIMEDSRGGLWVGTIMFPDYQTHLIRFDPNSKTSQVFPIQSSIWQMCESSDGTIWIAGAGLSGKAIKMRPKPKVYDFQNGQAFELAEQFLNSDLYDRLGLTSENFDDVLNMAIDPTSDRIWLSAVVAKNPPSQERIALLIDYNPKNKICEFHEIPDLKHSLNIGIPGNRYMSSGMAIDKRGRIWSTFRSEQIGVFCYDPKTRTVPYHFAHNSEDSTSLSSNLILAMMMDSRGEIWAATFESGLNRINPSTGQITRYHFDDYQDYANSDAPRALMEDKDGSIWVGGRFANVNYSETISDRSWQPSNPFIAIIDPITDTMSKIHLPVLGQVMEILDLAQSPITGNVVFTIHGNGLGKYLLETDEFQFFDRRNGVVPIRDYTDIHCDSQGRWWVSNETVGDYLLLSENMEWQFISNSHGAGNYLRKSFKTPDGSLYYINRFGWDKINPSAIQPTTATSTNNISLVDLFINGQKQFARSSSILSNPLWLTDNLTLPHDAESFEITMSSFDYDSSIQQFQYRLSPYETAWRKTGTSPIATYQNIQAGTYKFEVSSLQKSSIADTELTRLEITILPPWWRTWWAYLLYGMLLIIGGISLHRFQKNRILKAERQRAQQKELEHAREIEKAYTELEVAHKDLKATQSQLIQSEKMASLGELTAGIAHEIQNPLNFVNNFSEVSGELLEEALEELTSTPLSEQRVNEAKDILNDLKQNLEKIHHHGGRAGSIVKGMLEHSRTASGEKIETDINALCDEYLRLTYHGLKAKDENFNASIDTQFEETIKHVNVIPQDIGRVLLNIMNNAFYAVNKRFKESSNGYEPRVQVRTQKLKDKVEISIQDNGGGIPEDLVDKIFQPFFTTKPTGQGTGLGLSLAYDIITKGHGGELKVKSKEGAGTEFVVELPG